MGDDNLFGFPPQGYLDALKEEYGPPKPITLEDLQRGWDFLMKKMREPPPERKRIISMTVYKRCQEAIAAGATAREVELVSYGYSLEMARDLCK